MLDSVFMSLNSGVIYQDFEGIIRDFNPAVEKILGLNPSGQQTLVELFLSLKVPPEDAENLFALNNLKKYIDQKQGITLTIVNASTGKQTRLSVKHVKEDNDRCENNPGIYTIIEDITDQEISKELLSQVEKLETAQERIHLGVWELEVNTNHVYWSRETYNLFYRNIELGPPNYSEFIFFIHPDDRYVVDEYFQRSLVTGDPHNIDFRTNPAIGPMRFLNTQYSCVKINDQVVKILGTNVDISSRVQVETSLRKRVDQLFFAAETAKIGYWEYNVDNDMFTFNDNFYAIFGTTADKVGGYKMSSSRYSELFLPPEDAMIVGNEVRKALQTKETNYMRKLRHRMIYADGRTGVLEVNIFIVKDKDGNTKRTYGVNQDITRFLLP